MFGWPTKDNWLLMQRAPFYLFGLFDSESRRQQATMTTTTISDVRIATNGGWRLAASAVAICCRTNTRRKATNGGWRLAVSRRLRVYCRATTFVCLAK